MIALFFASIIVASAIMLFGKSLKLKVRIGLSVLAILLMNLPTIAVLIVGDKAPPGARTVIPQELHGHHQTNSGGSSVQSSKSQEKRKE